jgi:hypothetical protein
MNFPVSIRVCSTPARFPKEHDRHAGICRSVGHKACGGQKPTPMQGVMLAITIPQNQCLSVARPIKV